MVISRLIVGLMSGTSLDGIDAVLLRVSGNGAMTKFRQLAYIERKFPKELKELIAKNSVPESSRVDEIARLNVLLAHHYANAVKIVARKARVKLDAIDLIGSHGQTIQHLPLPQRMYGKTIRATLQIGDPSVLATLTGIPTVGNFRAADTAVGGQGAPLVPYFDFLAFHSNTKNRVLLNIGGIANVTILPRGCRSDEVVAFDTGPGNMVVDALMQRLFRKAYDKDGTAARSGMVSLELFGWMTRHPFLRRRPPKSTGREEFGTRFVEELLKRSRGVNSCDIITTASEFTVHAIHNACSRFVKKGMPADEIIVSGGGARNRYFTGALARYFEGAAVCSSDELGVSSDAKEAICFAILANEAMAGNPANLPRVTGAQKPVVLGTISPSLTRRRI